MAYDSHIVSALELNQAQQESERTKGKFIEDWDEEKQEYRTDSDKKEEEAVVANTSQILDRQEEKVEGLSQYKDPTEIQPSDYYKFKKQQMAQDIERGEREREQAEKTAKAQEEARAQRAASTSSPMADQIDQAQQELEAQAEEQVKADPSKLKSQDQQQ